MVYILLLILFALFFHLSARVGRVESLIKKGGTVTSEPSGVQPSDQQANTTQSVPLVASTPSASALPMKPVSSEEMSGKILGRLGIGAVVLGVAFFLKYAFDNNWVGPGGRVMIGILIGLALLGLGQWLRKKYLGYSDLLMGGGLTVLYLSVFCAHALYNLIDPMMTFMAMTVITVFGVIMSIMNATPALATIALIGGYLTPGMIGRDLIGATMTFTYVTILNIGVLGILVYKKWEALILIGLFGTWIHFSAFLLNGYNEALLPSTLFFIIIQFLIFTGASVTRIIIEKLKATEIDYILLAITAVSFAAASYRLLMPEYPDGTALGAVIVALLYGVMAIVAYKENPSDRSLNIFLPGLSVAFLTAAIAMKFSGPWMAAWWLIEAVVLYIVASKSSSRGFQVMGVIVYMMALLKTLIYVVDFGRPAGYVVFFNGPFIMLCFAIVVAYAIAFVYYRYGSINTDIQKRGITVFVVIANILTLYALTAQITDYYYLQLDQVTDGNLRYQIRNTSNTVVSIFWALYAALLTVIGFAKKISSVRRMGLILFIITAFKVVVDVWNLGELYRIVSFIVFGIIALVASFMYVKYKDRLKDVI